MQATASADCDALAPDVFDADRAALANLLSALPKRTPRFIARLIPSWPLGAIPGSPLKITRRSGRVSCSPRTISFQGARWEPELSEPREEKRGPPSESGTPRPGLLHAANLRSSRNGRARRRDRRAGGDLLALLPEAARGRLVRRG